MGMLDSDSEELKRQNERSDGEVNSSGSGRKVNQSGLGALKHLAKINNLTAKHRSQGSVSAKTASVEQSAKRGTIETKTSNSDAKQVQNRLNTDSLDTSEACPYSDSKRVHNAFESGSDIAVASHSMGKESTCENEIKQIQNGFNSGLLNGHLDNQKLNSPNDSGVKVELTDQKSPVALIEIEGELNDDLKNRGNITESNRVQVEPLRDSSSTNHAISPTADFIKPIYQTEVQKGFETGSKQVRNGIAEAPLANSIDPAYADSKRIQYSDKSGSILNKEKIQRKLPIETKQVQKGFKTGSKLSAQYVTEGDPFESNIGFNSGSIRAHSEKMINPAVRIFKDDRHSGKSSNAEPDSILAISGSQKAVLELIFKLCVFNNSMVCPPISKFQISSETGLSELTVKTALRRLGEKAYISLFEFKRGKSGWSKFEIAEKSYKELIQLRGVAVHANLTQVPTQRQEVRMNEPEPQRATWFRSLDFTKVSPINPMQVNVTIRNLVQSNLDPETVQEFINRFTSWLATQGKVSSPIGLFCDKLKELATEGESAVFFAVTDEDRAAQNAYLEKVEKIRLENELAEKARAHEAQQDIDAKFAQWYLHASQEDQESLCKPSQIAPFGTDNYRSVLKLAFGEKLIEEKASHTDLSRE